MSNQVISTRAANALVEDAEVDLRGLGSIAPGFDAIGPVLGVFKKAYGGLWVGGRATLTVSEVSFHPSAMNRAMQTGTLDIAVPLPAILGVELLSGFVTRIIAIHTPGFLVKIRCFGANTFADQIRSAAHNARGD